MSRFRWCGDADHGVVVVLDDEPPPDRHDTVRQAVLGCPSGALRLVS